MNTQYLFKIPASFIIAALLLLCAGQAAQCATNPFLTPQKQHVGTKQQEVRESPFTGNPSPAATDLKANDRTAKGNYTLYSRLIAQISILQKDIRMKLTGFARGIKKDPFGKPFWLFLAFAFAYGVVHAIGPGHGKSVVCAYFMSRSASMAAASFMSWLITIVHVGSATIAVCLAFLFLQKGMAGFETFNNYLQTASFGLVALIGLWLTINALRSFKKEQDEKVEVTPCSFREIATISFVTGIVPCPGAAIILVYTLSMGILPAGLLAMLFLATGMAVSTSVFAFTAAKARKMLDRTSFTGRIKLIYSLLSLCGSMVILLFGAVMLAGHLA